MWGVMRISPAFLLVISVLLAGCMNHPLVDDTARYSTSEIIQKVRCEAKEGLEFALSRKRPDFDRARKALVELQSDIERLSDAIGSAEVAQERRNKNSVTLLRTFEQLKKQQKWAEREFIVQNEIRASEKKTPKELEALSIVEVKELNNRFERRNLEIAKKIFNEYLQNKFQTT